LLTTVDLAVRAVILLHSSSLQQQFITQCTQSMEFNKHVVAIFSQSVKVNVRSIYRHIILSNWSGSLINKVLCSSYLNNTNFVVLICWTNYSFPLV